MSRSLGVSFLQPGSEFIRTADMLAVNKDLRVTGLVGYRAQSPVCVITIQYQLFEFDTGIAQQTLGTCAE